MQARCTRPKLFRRSLLSLAILGAGPLQSYAQQQPAGSGLEEILVTATRRTESLQDVPIAVQALTTETLSQLNVSVIDDFIKYLPSVSTANLGPGQGNIYMRGLSIGALGTQGQGSVGQWPNVAVYLDEQSSQMPGRNLDIYAADLERIEVLEGPQGTLFGAGAQAGVLRYITNKPKMNETSGSLTGSYGTTEHGDDNSGFEGVLNLPLIKDKLALRAVAYNESRGGYIDNVESTFTRAGTDAGFALLTGGVAPADSVAINNFNLAQDDINDVDYKGFRVSLAWQINDDWDALIAQSFQDMNADGVFYQHPNGSESGCLVNANCPNSTQSLNDLEVTLFNDSYTKDKFRNTAWTLHGKAAMLDIIYTGAYLKRDSDQIQDYTNYARGVYGIYYQCTGYSAGYGGAPTKCYTPSAVWKDVTENKNTSHELRISTPDDWRLRGIAGLFWEKRELNDETDWLYKSLPECVDGGPGDCFLYLNPSESPQFQSASMNNTSRRNQNTGFFDDFQRTYEQKAIFASVDFDIIPDVLTATVGSRYYEIDNEMLGGAMSSFSCKLFTNTAGGAPTDGLVYSGSPNGDPCINGAGINLDEQDPHDSNTSDHKSRANISWNITEDIMVYATWSEGYRPGGFNRGRGGGALKDVNGVPQWYVPLEYESDELTNYELGWKTRLLDNRLQFNGAVYHEEWDHVITGIFAPQLGMGNLTVALNGPDYEVEGIEFQFIAQLMDGLTIQGSASHNESELKESPGLVNNNPAHPNFGQPIDTAYVGSPPTQVTVTNVFGKEGDELANSPENQANIRARYEWTMNDLDMYGQIGAAYQDESLSSATVVNQYTMDDWVVWDASFGVSRDQWTVEFYGANLTDENTSVFTSAAQFIVAEVPMRPRTLSLRIGYRFGGE